MTTAELLELTQQRLGDVSRTYYPASLVITFLNMAQNLLALQPQYALRKRTATTISAYGCFVDLRVVVPRYLRIRRVVLGSVATQAEEYASGYIRRLRRTSLEALAARSQWIAEESVPRLYFLQGRTILGVSPRPSSDIIITILTTELPTPLSTNTPTQEPELQASNHPFIADVATGLILLREGTIEGQKGAMMLAQGLPPQQLQGLLKAIGGLKQEAVDRQQAASGAVVQTT